MEDVEDATSQNDDNDMTCSDKSENIAIEHYECCHKPLPEYTNVDSLREVHDALGFLKDGVVTQKHVFLEEKGDSKMRHCIKLINGELYLFCNVKTKEEFVEENNRAFKEASAVEVDDRIPDSSRLTQSPQLHDQVVSFDKDFESFVDGLTLPMNEEQLYRHQKSQF